MKLAELAKHLRKMADHIGRDELASRPVSWVLVLEGESGKHEVLTCGSLTRDRLAKAAGAVSRCAWDAKAARPTLKLFEVSTAKGAKKR